MYADSEYWLWITLAFGPGNSRKWNTLSHYQSVREAYEHISSGHFGAVAQQDRQSVASVSMERVKRLIEYCSKKRINIYCYDDPDFPVRLKEIYNPPSVLFSQGDLSKINDTVVISAVGTRSPGNYSEELAKRICCELSGAGAIIASGFAPGLDSIALRSAADAGGRAIAVLPCGLLFDYPKNSGSLRADICRKGAIISEYLPEDKPSGISFRLRNRLLSGISLGVLVIQAGEKSGALSTASFAVSQGKDIFCIPPHELYSSEYSGVIPLLRDGAIPVFETRDILKEYYSLYPHKLNYSALSYDNEHQSGIKNPQRRPADTRSEEKRAEKSSESDIPDLSALSPDKRKIIEYIMENGAALFDELASIDGGIPEPEVLITDMELEGLIKPLSGNRFTI